MIYYCYNKSIESVSFIVNWISICLIVILEDDRMNYSRFNHKHKTRAQAMVEFALALPLLLLLVFGLMETGRLLFIYSSTVSAAREAVRYGSAMGKNTSNLPYYQDCAGIKKAAQNVGFINRFNDADILITYDGGLNDTTGAMIDLIPPGPSCGSFSSVKNGDRIKVSVSTQWVPIVSIVPFKGFTITSSSERTIIASISISAPIILSNADKTATAVANTQVAQTQVAAAFTQAAAVAQTQTAAVAQTQTAVVVAQTQTAAVAQTQIAAAATLAATPPQQISLFVSPNPYTPNPASLKVGDRITFTYILQNKNSSPITGVSLSVPGNFVVAQDGNCTGTIAPNTSITCTGSRIIDQADIDRGTMDNIATANGSYTNFWNTTFSVTSNSVSSNFKISQTPILTVVSASASPSQPTSPATTIPAGTVITYTYTLKNTGNVTLSPTVTDINKTSTVTCPILVPGDTKDCKGTYTVKDLDITAGKIIKTENVSYGANPQVNIPATITVITNICTTNTVKFTSHPTVSNSKAATWTIQNDTGVSLTISNIKIIWKDKKLTQVLFPSSTSIWSGTSSSNTGFSVPATYPLSLPIGATDIKLIFDNNTKNIAIEITLQQSGCPAIK